MPDTKIKILHRSENEIVVFKPPGIATQLSDDVKGSSLESILKNQLGIDELYFPHRLDRITSGLLLIALNKESILFYNEEIKSTHFQKYYVAKVENKTKNIRELIGTHKRFLKSQGNISTIVRSGGKPSFLDILCIQPNTKQNDCYDVLIRLITGRMHQIRIMLADLGIPLCGDHIYNKKSKFSDFYLESAVLKFRDMESVDHIYFYNDKPDRETFSNDLSLMLEDIISY